MTFCDIQIWFLVLFCDLSHGTVIRKCAVGLLVSEADLAIAAVVPQAAQDWGHLAV